MEDIPDGSKEGLDGQKKKGLDGKGTELNAAEKKFSGPVPLPH